MAKMQVKGTGDVEEMLRTLGDSAGGIAKMAVYDGASVVTDEVRRTTAALKESEPGRPRETRKIYASVTDPEKKQLLEGLGVARIRHEDGSWYTVIGFAGYGGRKTSKYPRGLPNALLARSINKPSALRKGSRFTQNAVKRAQDKATSAMAKRVETEITKIIAE